MAVPKRKVSHARGAKRRANWNLEIPALARCPRCHAYKLAHRVCPECGYYKGTDVLKLEADEK